MKVACPVWEGLHRNRFLKKEYGTMTLLHRVMTTTGAPAALAESTIQDLRRQLRGELLRPGDDDYERARKVWNGMIDKRPALIARCTGVADVMAAVQFAREHDLLVAVRGGGHSLPGFSVCDDGL